jgi:hypothetical protein
LFAGALAMAQVPTSGTGRLDFRVATTKGDLVAAASVTIEGPDGKTYSGKTGTDGYWRVADLPAGLYKFRAFDAPGYLRFNRNFLEDFFIHDGKTSQTGLQLIPSPKIHGIVTDEDGNPIQGATVTGAAWVDRGSPGPSVSATTDSQGFYWLSASVDPAHFLAKFPVTIQVSVHAYVSRERAAQTGQAFFPYTTNLVLASLLPTVDQTRDFNLRATPVFHIKGRIAGTLAPGQAPLVWITHCSAPAEETLTVRVVPGADGTFDATGILPAFYCVELEMNQVRSSRKTLTVTDRDVEQVELAVPASTP